MKIYISGKISGLPLKQVKAKFDYADRELRQMGYTKIINPLNIKHKMNATWRDFMENDIIQLIQCDAIYVLLDYKKSKGAMLELHIARKLGLKIIYQERVNR